MRGGRRLGRLGLWPRRWRQRGRGRSDGWLDWGTLLGTARHGTWLASCWVGMVAWEVFAWYGGGDGSAADSVDGKSRLIMSVILL